MKPNVMMMMMIGGVAVEGWHCMCLDWSDFNWVGGGGEGAFIFGNPFAIN